MIRKLACAVVPAKKRHLRSAIALTALALTFASAGAVEAPAPLSHFEAMPPGEMGRLGVKLTWLASEPAHVPTIILAEARSVASFHVGRFGAFERPGDTRTGDAFAESYAVATGALAAVIDTLASSPDSTAELTGPPCVSVVLLDAVNDSTFGFEALLSEEEARKILGLAQAWLAKAKDARRGLEVWSCALGTRPASAAKDVTAEVMLNAAVLWRDPRSGLVDLKVRLTNGSDRLIPGPISIVPPREINTFLVDPDGISCWPGSIGEPYVRLPGQGLAPGNSTGAVLRFKSPPLDPARAKLRVFSG